MKAASQSSRIPLRESEAAMGMVPYMHRGEAMPRALAAAMPSAPARPPRRERSARWIAPLAKTETAEPTSMPSTHQPRICSSCTVK